MSKRIDSAKPLWKFEPENFEPDTDGRQTNADDGHHARSWAKKGTIDHTMEGQF